LAWIGLNFFRDNFASRFPHAILIKMQYRKMTLMKSCEVSQSDRFIFKRRQTRSAEADGAYFNPILCLESIKSNSRQ